jgi:hypothetical protein
MPQLTPAQLKSLRDLMANAFAGPSASLQLFNFMYFDVEVPPSDFVTEGAPLALLVGAALAKLNGENKVGRLLDALEQRLPERVDLLTLITQLRPQLGPPSGSEAAARMRQLEAAGLLLDGLAFINRNRLREILGELCDLAGTARVGVITGASLCGKTWSQHLIKAHCRATGRVKPLFLDMERIQPGNDPVIVWSELLRRLIPGNPLPGPPVEDTKRGQYAMRLAEEVCACWDAWEDPRAEQKPLPLVVFDHLEKNAAAAVGPAIVDFAEALALAAVERRFDGARVLLLGFPRAFVGALVMQDAIVAPRESVEPLSDAEIARYLDDVGQVIGRGAPPLIAQQASLLLAEAYAKLRTEERRQALVVMSNTIGAHVATLAKAV